jgi:anti-anti-sigma factor
MNWIEEDVRDCPYIVLDVTGMDFADSTYFRFLIRVLTYAGEKNGGSIHLVGANRRLQHILEATGLGDRVTYEPTAK